MLKLLNGPHTFGSGPVFWVGFVVVIALVLAYPLVATPYDVGNFAYFFIWLFMALGLCLMWGYGGIMSFGQTFFFGLAGYGYGVIAINLGGKGFTTFEALGLAVLLSGAAAAILGYFMIWGRVGGVFFGIVTLASSLVLAFFLGQTAGPEWKIGRARLNGFNGMKGMKALNIPWGGHTLVFDGAALYFLMVALVVIVYLALRMLVNSRFGNVIVAIRENEQRAELLGYDVRKYRLATFCIGSALAGLSGALYTAWGQFITPASVGLPAAAMPIVWVSFSGRRELTATLVGTFIFLYAYQLITVYSQQSALVLTGLLLLLAVMFVPEGFVVGLAKLARMPWRKGSPTQLSLQPGE